MVLVFTFASMALVYTWLPRSWLHEKLVADFHKKKAQAKGEKQFYTSNKAYGILPRATCSCFVNFSNECTGNTITSTCPLTTAANFDSSDQSLLPCDI